jgi:hypothetical protein
MAQEDVALQVDFLLPVLLMGQGLLFFERVSMERQEALEAELAPLLRGERRPLVQQGTVEEQVPGQRHLQEGNLPRAPEHEAGGN